MGRDISRKLKRRAQSLGLLNLPRAIFYASASGVERMFADYCCGMTDDSTFVPNSAKIIELYLSSVDHSTQFDLSGYYRNKSIYILAENIRIFVEVEARVSGLVSATASNHVIKVNIYCQDINFTRNIAISINNAFREGVIAGTNWDKIESKFAVRREDCITAWKNVLM